MARNSLLELPVLEPPIVKVTNFEVPDFVIKTDTNTNKTSYYPKTNIDRHLDLIDFNSTIVENALEHRTIAHPDVLNVFCINPDKLNYNEDLAKLFYLCFWVKYNIVVKFGNFISTSDLFDRYNTSMNGKRPEITYDGFSKGIEKAMRVLFYNFTKKRLDGVRGYVGIIFENEK